MAAGNRVIRSFVPALYPVAALLAISPLAEIFGAARGAHPDDAAWRFGIVGLGFDSIVLQTLGLALALGVAAWLGHRRVLRFVSVTALLCAVMVVAGIARFLLDFSQVQTVVAPAEQAVFEAAALRALVVATLAVPVLVVLGGRGWMASSIGSEPVSPDAPSGRPRVIPFPGQTRAPDPRWPRR